MGEEKQRKKCYVAEDSKWPATCDQINSPGRTFGEGLRHPRLRQMSADATVRFWLRFAMHDGHYDT